ncbi:hypothetical protein JNM05_10680 [bacterium]|nr:hypothetical protein [bacterium]
MQKLLVSVRGPKEALVAIVGGARIVDAEYPESALGKVYPLNIATIKSLALKHKGITVSTNIGEKQLNRKTACQMGLGVATAGADIIKIGMAGLNRDKVEMLTDRVSRTIKHWYPRSKVIPAFFVDTALRKSFDPFIQVAWLANFDKIDGILIDTYNKEIHKDLLDYVDVRKIKSFVDNCHKAKLEAWIAGSIKLTQIKKLWQTGVDVICVRSAACGSVTDRGGTVRSELVSQLLPGVQ